MNSIFLGHKTSAHTVRIHNGPDLHLNVRKTEEEKEPLNHKINDTYFIWNMNIIITQHPNAKSPNQGK